MTFLEGCGVVGGGGGGWWRGVGVGWGGGTIYKLAAVLLIINNVTAEYSARMQTREDLVATMNPRLPKASASARSGADQNQASHASRAARHPDFAVSVCPPGSFSFIHSFPT